MAKTVYGMDNRGPQPVIGEIRIRPPVHQTQYRIVATKIKRDWVEVAYADGPKKGQSAGKMRRYIWNNYKRSHKK